MKTDRLILLLTIATAMFGCNGPKENSNAKNNMEQAKTLDYSEEAHANLSNVEIDSLIKVIDNERKDIESKVGEPLVVNTTDLREKIKQKWEKIHFYSIDGHLARIKTYPYQQISKRTEEFYLDNQGLILAVVEDKGMEEKGGPDEQMDKLYYFSQDEPIKEVHSQKEHEYAIKNSDAEELLEEVREYQDIYSHYSKK